MTRAFWNSQFRFSEVIPGFAAYVERMEAESAVLPEDSFVHAAYGPSYRQWVEWMDGRGPETLLPVIIHGGYWRALRAEDHRFLMPAFASLGGHVANIEYRLMPGTRLDGLIGDTRAALECLRTRFPQARLLLVGHSAGAHLALAAATDARLTPRIHGIIALSGVYDLTPIALSFLQDEIALGDDEIRRFSLEPSTDRPPVLYVNGARETAEFLRAGALMSSMGRAEWQVMPGVDHMSLLWAAMAEAEGLTEKLLQLEGTAP